MNHDNRLKVHWSFWLVAIAGLLWNVGGAANYLMQTNPEMITKMPESHQAIITNRPGWATGGFAVGVFVGVIGCLLLLLRRKTAQPALLISLAGVLLTVGHTLAIAASAYKFSTIELVMMVLMPVLVSLMLWLYSRTAKNRLWLH